MDSARRKFLQTAGLVALLAPISSCRHIAPMINGASAILENQDFSEGEKTSANQTVDNYPTSQKISAVQDSPASQRTQSPQEKLIRKHIEEFSEFYVERFKVESTDMAENIRREGLEQITQDFSYIFSEALDYAVENPQGEISQIELRKTSKEIIRRMKDGNVPCTEGDIDYSDQQLNEKAEEGFRIWLDVRVKHYRKLLESEGETSEELIRNAYVREEYDSFLKESLGGSEIFFNSLKKGLGFFIKWPGSIVINSRKDLNERIYREYADEIYGENEAQPK